MIKDQDILGSDEAVKKFLTMIPEEKLRNTLEKAMLDYHDSTSRWRVFEELSATTNKSNKVRYKYFKLY
jgi:hypothetical protein